MARTATPLDTRGRTRVAVAADHGLVAESIRAALSDRGFDAQPLRLRRDLGVGGALMRGRRRALLPGTAPDVGILLSDLDRSSRIRTGQALIRLWEVPWLVLAGAARGPAWGALYERGASLVVPTSTSLREVCELLEDLAAGRVPRDADRGRGELIGSWRSFVRDRDRMAARLATLTEREDEVLQLLCGGLGVRQIAIGSEVAETTVRSQVKAILRKLEVSSQIAAVAAYQEFHLDGTGHPVTPQRLSV
jgi:two-component system, NarL family, nitrate/nitrite response regulator NarL